MRKPLQPKALIRNTHPLLEHRLAAARNGWVQNPCTLKRKTCKGWNKLPCDEAAIQSLKEWRDPYFAGTAVRIVGDLAAYDSDITIPEISDLVLDDFYGLDEAAYNAAIMRDSGGVSQALFFRSAQPFRHFKTRSYTQWADGIAQLEAAYAMPETTEAEHAAKIRRVREIRIALEPQKVEIYGGLSSGRYFQMEGPHSEGREYHCGAAAPWNTAVSDLPLLPIGPGLLIDHAEDILKKHLTLIPEPVEPAGDRVYDLTPDTPYYPKDGERGTIAELTDGLEAGPEHGIRGCMASTVLTSASRENCNLYITQAGRVTITDWSHDGRQHYMADEAPAGYDPDALREALTRMQQTNAGGQEPPRQPPLPPDLGGSFDDAVDWMVETFCFCKGDMVMPVYAVDPLDAVPVKEFHNRYQMYNRPPDEPRRTALVYATKRWMGDARRKSVDGYDMRPDQRFPIFEEDGRSYKNTYRPPQHAGEGDIEPWERFIRHLLPKDAERKRFLEAMAHKRQHPATPGPAIIMVAESEENLGEEQSGTGRGTLFKILIRVFGWRYAKLVDFEIFAGTSHRATYTAWQAELVMAFIEESKEEKTSGFFGGRSVYEHTKSMIDIDARRATVRSIYGKDREAMLNCTYLIASNHGNAFRIPASDRRFLILSNGEKMSEEMAVGMDTWMKVPGNIAALDRWFASHDVSHYNPMAAPMMTEARERMVDQSLNEMDRAVREALTGIRGKAFMRAQVLAATTGLLDDPMQLQTGAGIAQFNQAFKRMTIGLSMPGKRPKMERRFRRGNAGQARGYVRSRQHERDCDAMDNDAVQAEIDKNGVFKLPETPVTPEAETPENSRREVVVKFTQKPPSGKKRE